MQHIQSTSNSKSICISVQVTVQVIYFSFSASFQYLRLLKNNFIIAELHGQFLI